jgi:hypothetical protein
LRENGEYYENDWPSHPERLEGLLASMANTPIKHSLEEIYIEECGLSLKQVMEMVERHGFTNIRQIVG